jgi:nucleoside-diphosphate-sugar epimerase
MKVLVIGGAGYIGSHMVKLLGQQGCSVTTLDNRAKLYSCLAPGVECISKGKSRNPYEFGVKVCLAMTLKGNLMAKDAAGKVLAEADSFD